MRTVLIIVAGLIVAAATTFYLLGVSPFTMSANLRLATGLGAKLACSGRYLTGLSEGQARTDILSYSPALNMLDLEYRAQSVSASVAGLTTTTATHRPGLGCTLDIGATAPLDQLRRPASPPPTADLWPLGTRVATDVDLQARTTALLSADNARSLNTRALVVVKNGRIVAEAYAPGYTADTPLLGWSMGKSLTAIMLARLAEQGRLGLDETRLFDSWDDKRATVSIEHLLRMSSGLAFEEDYARPSDATEMLFMSHSASGVAERSTLEHAPGSHFAYSSGTTNLLSALYMQRTGSPQAALNELFAELFNPLRIRSATLEVDPSGVFVGSSYIYASARDWARLGLLMLRDGVFDGARLLPAGWTSAAARPNKSANDSRYGYQFWLNTGRADRSESARWPALPDDAYAMRGNRAQEVMMVPSADLVLVRLGWSSGAYPTNDNFAALLESAAAL